MKKSKLYIFLAAILLIGGITLLHSVRNTAQVEGIVPDEKTAITLAEIIFISRYGETVTKFRPFMAEYDVKHACWVIKGTLSDGILGGVPQLTIAQRDGQILSISHGK